MSGIGSPQHLLWAVGTSLIEAGPDDADARLDAAIRQVSEAVGAISCGLFESDPATGVNRVLVGCGIDESIFDEFPSGAGRLGIAEGGGHIVVDLETLFGPGILERRGWPDGRAIISAIDDAPDRQLHLVTVALDPDWQEAELELLRGFGLLVRQFRRRVEAERSLGGRRRLDRLALRLAEELQGVTGGQFDTAIEPMLRAVMDAFEGHAVFLVDAIDEEHVEIPVLVTRGMHLPDIGRLDIGAVNALTGADVGDVYDLMSRTRVLDATVLTGGLLGESSDEYAEAQEIQRGVVLVPVEVAGFAGTAIGVSRPSSQPWRPFEIDALAAIVSLIAQARARCLAEIDSQARFVLQQVLSDVGRRFVNVDAADAIDAADVALRDVAESLGAAFALAMPVGDGDLDRVDLRRVWVGPDAHEPGSTALADLGLNPDDLAPDTTAVPIRLAPGIVSAWGLDDEDYRLVLHRVDRLGIRIAIAYPAAATALAAIGPEALAALGDLASQLQLRVDAEVETREQLATEAVLSDVADDFLGGSARTVVEVENRALERIGTLLGLQALRVGAWGDGGVVERAWSADGATGSGVRAYDDGALVVPVVLAGEPIAELAAVRSGTWTDRDRGVLRSVATMLGQFRSRVRSEQRDELRLQAEQLLSDFAAELADATSETLTASVNAAFGSICDAMDLTCLTIWRMDPDARLYRALYRAVPDECADGLPEPRPFGSDPNLDRVREAESWITGADPDDPTGERSVLAFRRGSEGRDSILIAKSVDPAQWTPDSRELFGEVSAVLNDVEVRVAAERYVDAAFDNAPVGIVLRDERLRLITCNEAFARFLGRDDPEELVGTLPDEVYADGIDRLDWVENGGRLETEAAFKRADGGRVWGHMRATVVEGDPGEHLWLVHVENITDRRRAEALLRFQATHDDLTGLANRGRLMQELQELISEASGAAVLLLDLDRFKNINDSLGHDRGDELLVAIADRLRLAVRPGDLVARLGGDEFAVSLAGPVTPTDAEFVAARLLRLIGEPILLGSQRVYPSASIGIAFGDSGDVADLMRRADTAMYRAKAQGRAQTALFDEALQLEVTERMATEAGLRGALRNDEFLVYYQPEVSTIDGSMLGAEALVRWNHPTDGILPAGAFIAVAEETGLVVDLGELVLAQAAAEAATWPGGDDGPIIRVNLAAAQLQREDTVALVRFVLQESGLAPHRLCLEITESAVMTDIGRSEQILHRLKELGVELAVDDFGTGFSSLAYLKRFPVDALKIDRSFVTGLGEEGTDGEDRTFVGSIISLASALDLEVVAEGVETERQAAVLAELGCHRAQGYLYGRPGPPEELRRFLPSPSGA